MNNPNSEKTGFTLKKALDYIDRGNIAPCYLIHGDDDFAVQSSMDQIVKKVLPDATPGFNLFIIDGDDDIERIYGEIMTPSLLAGRKVVVLRNTGLFRSKNPAADSFRRAVDSLDRDPGRALKHFRSFMKIAGFDMEDLEGENWKNIPEKDWKKLLGEDYPEMMQFVPVLAGLAPGDNFSAKGSNGGAEAISELLEKGFPEGNILVITADSVDQRKNLYKHIAQSGVVIAHVPPKYEKGKIISFSNSVRENMEKRGKKITPEAISALGKRTDNDIRTALSEIDKLVSYVGERDLIEEADIEEIAVKRSTDNAFRLNSCIVEKDLRGALDVLNDLLVNSEPALKILSLIIREFRLLLQAKILLNAGILSSFKPGLEYSGFQSGVYPEIKSAVQKGLFLGDIAGQHPYVIYSAIRNSSRFSYEKLLTDLKYLLEVDISFKSTRIDQQIVLESVLIRMCS